MSATAAFDLKNVDKNVGGGVDRDKLPASSYVFPDEKAFPIVIAKDVKDAVSSWGRYKGTHTFAEFQKKLTALAKRKGFGSSLPDAWTKKKATAKNAALAPFITQVQLADAVDNQPRSSWAQLLRTGSFYDPRYGDFDITRKDLATMAANFRTKYPKDPTRLAIDYNHGTSRPNSADEGKAAGWITDVQLRANGDELWGQVEWTETAASMIEAKEYQFVSATFSFDYTNSNGGEEIGPTLLAAAVTNRPVVHGMQPLTLSLAHPAALQLAVEDADPSDPGDGQTQDQADEDDIAEQLFSFDEQRRRVQAALTAMFGLPYFYSGYDAPIRGVYLEALFDDYVIYGDSDGNKYKVGYALGTDGSVTFTTEPVEVRVSYEPLTQEQSMSTKTVTFKDAKGAEQKVELAQEAIDAIVSAHGSKGGAVAELGALRSTVETQGATIVELTAATKALKEKNDALELAAKTADAKAKVDTLVRAGKLDPKDREAWQTLALENPASFATLSATLVKRRELEVVAGSEGDNTTATDANSELKKKADEIRAAQPKLSEAAAMDLAIQQNPDLYKAADAQYMAGARR